MTNTISRNQQTLESWLATLNNKRGQITNTIYDLPYPGFVGLGDPRMVITQRNLRNRVSYTTLTHTGTTNAYSQGTFYTYDILGNVNELLQDYGYSSVPNVMNQRGNRWKKIRYQYDLISGKVNMVMYQPGYRDAFFHRYGYDTENRLTLVETSRDSLVWEKDARYEYYRHGPLARVILGEQQVQGIDYAYTLQGWLKGINSSGGTETFDMGEDGKAGSLNQFTARDVFGLTLNYFGNDYTAINGTPFPTYSGKLPVGEFRPLFNGNISSSSVYQKKFEGEVGGPLIFYNYKYDQLNRLTRQDAFEGIYNTTSGYWDTLATMGERLKERIAYDANGNILKYLRNSIKPNQVKMDSLSYIYYPNSNQLRRIKDTVSDNLFYDSENQIVDIDSQPDSNYVYDAIGNLIKDSAEKITSIKWNVYGKIEEINRIATDTVPASNIKYTYDAMGNRISQVVTSNGTKNYTWYVRDAQGNILSTYTAQGNSSLDLLKLQLADRFMYGSSRLGTITINDPDVDGGPGNTEYYYEDKAFGYDRGYKSYELTNHLGNVLATVSDRKFGVSSGGSSLIDHYEPHIVTAQDYYPFGMLSRVALPSGNKSYAFGFNGKMNDNDVKGGLGNQQDYGMRIYDPRIGKFLSVDPISKSYPWNSPYAFAENDVIRSIDFDGLEKLIVHQRVFAPWENFGSILPFQKAYKGDNRNFSLNYIENGKPVTSRIYQIAKLDLTTSEIISADVKCDPSIGPRNFYGPQGSSTETPDQVNVVTKTANGEVNFNGNISGHDARIFDFAAPDIDFTGDYTFRKDGQNLVVDFKLKGKGFPAYESFIEDQKGVRISISTYGVNSKNQILKLIRVDDGEWIRSAESSIIVPLDKDGNFTNVIKLPENTYVNMNGQKTEFTISEWNDKIKNIKAANDRDDNSTNKNTTNKK